MNLNWNVFSLVIASATGWTLLAFGYLPVAVLRQHGREPLKGAAAWALVAATAPSAIFHWYLIFAILCLVAWTKLDRLAGKFWLATSAALGLSLGIVFPLEVLPSLMLRESPFVLASLYLGGAVAGLTYVIFVLIGRASATGIRPTRLARWFLILDLGWTALLAFGMLRGSDPRPLDLFKDPLTHAVMVDYWTPLVPAVALVALAFFTYAAVSRGEFRRTRWLAGAASGLTIATSFLAQIVFRFSDLNLAG